MKPHTIDTSVVRLDMCTLDLAILGNDSVALATIIAEQGGTVKLDVPRASEVAGRVAEEADATGLILVERLGPCFHAVGFFCLSAQFGLGLLSVIVLSGVTYTNASLTDTTNTLPALVRFGLEM